MAEHDNLQKFVDMRDGLEAMFRETYAEEADVEDVQMFMQAWKKRLEGMFDPKPESFMSNDELTLFRYSKLCLEIAIVKNRSIVEEVPDIYESYTMEYFKSRFFPVIEKMAIREHSNFTYNSLGWRSRYYHLLLSMVKESAELNLEDEYIDERLNIERVLEVITQSSFLLKIQLQKYLRDIEVMCLTSLPSEKWSLGEEVFDIDGSDDEKRRHIILESLYDLPLLDNSSKESEKKIICVANKDYLHENGFFPTTRGVTNSELSKDIPNFISVETCIQYLVFWANSRSLREKVNDEIDSFLESRKSILEGNSDENMLLKDKIFFNIYRSSNLSKSDAIEMIEKEFYTLATRNRDLNADELLGELFDYCKMNKIFEDPELTNTQYDANIKKMFFQFIFENQKTISEKMNKLCSSNDLFGMQVEDLLCEVGNAVRDYLHVVSASTEELWKESSIVENLCTSIDIENEVGVSEKTDGFASPISCDLRYKLDPCIDASFYSYNWYKVNSDHYMLWKRGQLLTTDKEERANRVLFSLFLLEDIKNTEILCKNNSDYLNRPPRDDDNDSLVSTLDELEEEFSGSLALNNVKDENFDVIDCFKHLTICENEKSIEEEVTLFMQTELKTANKTVELLNHHLSHGHTSFFNSEMSKEIYEEPSDVSTMIDHRVDKQFNQEQCNTPKREVVPVPVPGDKNAVKISIDQSLFGGDMRAACYGQTFNKHCSIDCHTDSLCRYVMKERFDESIPNAFGECVMKRKVAAECETDIYASKRLELRLSLVPYVSYSNFEGATFTQPVTNFSQALDQIRLSLTELDPCRGVNCDNYEQGGKTVLQEALEEADKDLYSFSILPTTLMKDMDNNFKKTKFRYRCREHHHIELVPSNNVQIKIDAVETCPICLKDISSEEAKEKIFLLNCGHVLCTYCLYKMINTTMEANPELFYYEYDNVFKYDIISGFVKNPEIKCPTCRAVLYFTEEVNIRMYQFISLLGSIDDREKDSKIAVLEKKLADKEKELREVSSIRDKTNDARKKWKGYVKVIFDAFMIYKKNVDSLVISFNTLSLSNNRLMDSLIVSEENNKVLKTLLQMYKDVIHDSSKHELSDLLGRSYKLKMSMANRLATYSDVQSQLKISQSDLLELQCRIKDIMTSMNRERSQHRIEKLEALAQKDILLIKLQKISVKREKEKMKITYLRTANKRLRDIVRVLTRRRKLTKKSYKKKKTSDV